MPSPSLKKGPDRLSIVKIAPHEVIESFGQSVRRGLLHSPKYLHCRFIYDEVGSPLFEQICEQPEYYLTRTEDAILNERADEMVEGWDRAPTMIELGSGSSTKTRRLIEAALSAYGRLHYVPVDVSPTILEESAHELVRDYAHLRVTGYATDYHTALDEVPHLIPGPKLFVFLGSSIGNFERDDAVALLRHLASAMGRDDRLLFGTDLVKAPEVLEAAYDDARGVTARFNSNILDRINRELGADFDLSRFRYEARYNPEASRVEMRQVSLTGQTVRIPGIDLTVSFEEGEAIHTENSHKYTPEILEELAHRAGFAEEHAWTDDRGLFRVQRWRPADRG